MGDSPPGGDAIGWKLLAEALSLAPQLFDLKSKKNLRRCCSQLYDATTQSMTTARLSRSRQHDRLKGLLPAQLFPSNGWPASLRKMSFATKFVSRKALKSLIDTTEFPQLSQLDVELTSFEFDASELEAVAQREQLQMITDAATHQKRWPAIQELNLQGQLSSQDMLVLLQGTWCDLKKLSVAELCLKRVDEANFYPRQWQKAFPRIDTIDFSNVDLSLSDYYIHGVFNASDDSDVDNGEAEKILVNARNNSNAKQNNDGDADNKDKPFLQSLWRSKFPCLKRFCLNVRALSHRRTGIHPLEDIQHATWLRKVEHLSFETRCADLTPLMLALRGNTALQELHISCSAADYPSFTYRLPSGLRKLKTLKLTATDGIALFNSLVGVKLPALEILHIDHDEDQIFEKFGDIDVGFLPNLREIQCAVDLAPRGVATFGRLLPQLESLEYYDDFFSDPLVTSTVLKHLNAQSAGSSLPLRHVVFDSFSSNFFDSPLVKFLSNLETLELRYLTDDTLVPTIAASLCEVAAQGTLSNLKTLYMPVSESTQILQLFISAAKHLTCLEQLDLCAIDRNDWDDMDCYNLLERAQRDLPRVEITIDGGNFAEMYGRESSYCSDDENSRSSFDSEDDGDGGYSSGGFSHGSEGYSHDSDEDSSSEDGDAW